MATSESICPACESVIVGPVLKAYQFCTSSKPAEFDTLRVITCDRCNFSFPDQKVSQDSLEAYYHEDYSGLAKKRGSKAVKNIYLSKYSYLPRSLSQIELIKHYVDFNSRPRVLEIGSGAGDFFRSLQLLGHETDNYAIEPQEDAHPSLGALGVNLINAALENDGGVDIGQQDFDLVVMSHALEHFNATDVLSVLKRVKMFLRPQGIFFCEVPNADLKKYPNAPEIVVPHLSFFSEQAIKIFLQKAGFHIEFLRTVGNSQFDNVYIGEEKSRELYGEPQYKLSANGRVLQNIGYLEQLEIHKRRSRRKRMALNLVGSVFGQAIIRKLIDIRAILRQPHVDKIFSSKYFQYGPDREYIRVIARRMT